MIATAPHPPPLYELEDGKLTFNFHQGQSETWKRNERFVLMCAGSQSGKTSFGPVWLWREIQRCGSGDYLAVTASYDLFQLKMLPELRNFYESLLGIATWRASERVLELSTPKDTRIILRSASSPEGLESSTAKAAWCDEAGQETFTLAAWEAVQRRTALNRGRILLSTTPYVENWLKTEVYDKWQRDQDSDYAVVNFSSLMNPVYPKEEYERAKRTWPAWKFNLFIMGTFDRPAGLIYNDFDPDTHVVDDFDVPREWPRYVGIDFGAVNHAMLWVAHNPETKVNFVYREEMSSGATTPERVKAAQVFAKKENVVGWYGGAKSERQFRSDWRAAGILVRQPPIADVEAGIDAVTEMIRTDHLRVFRSCSRLRDEFAAYRRKLDERDNPTIEILNKNQYHCCLVAGTLVETLCGPVPIEDVRRGDIVRTHKGWRHVEAAQMTKADTPTFTVSTASGNSITGTGNHPVLTQRGFVSIDALRYTDTVSVLVEDQACEVKKVRSDQRSSSSVASTITDILTHQISLSSGISNMARGTFIERCGRLLAGRSRQVSQSTISTTTGTTTNLAISNSFGTATTDDIITRGSAPLQKLLISQLFDPSRALGTPPTLVEHGTALMEPILGPSESREISSAKVVARPSSLSSQRGSVFARIAARLRSATRAAWTTKLGSANSAVLVSSSIGTHAFASVPVAVLDVRSASNQAVYNLTVADAHTYYANGILVSNCDALRYVLPAIGRRRSSGGNISPIGIARPSLWGRQPRVAG